ncbi:MAG TPA: hypothetical protein VFM08_03170 [Nocardioides sp.]|jgi:hypothetical protein|nr:hypothetical protein [Nocardioides sp.]
MASRLTGRVAAVATAVVVAGLAVVLAIVAAGNSASPSGAPAASPSTPTLSSQPQAHSVARVKPKPLRPGESRMALRMDSTYRPSAPNGGTDDYRCFLLDPHLTQERYLTGTFVKPDNPDVVHHVILFRVDPAQVATAEQLDDTYPGEGWTCFGDSGLPDSNDLNDASWLGAWAPGGQESVDAPGYGVPLQPGSRIVMQVHYNLLAGSGPDRSAALLRLAPRSARLTPISTMLLPAPVELPCRPGHTDNPLCDRTASIADVVQRFGVVGQTGNWLNVLCGEQRDTQVTTCTRTIREPTTIRAVAGHMHLLGRSIKIQVDPGTPRARTILDIPIWDFDNQAAHRIKPVTLQPGETVKVTCKHVQWLRDQLPAFQGQPDRYVVWGEGTTDEMCLGILAVTHP